MSKGHSFYSAPSRYFETLSAAQAEDVERAALLGRCLSRSPGEYAGHLGLSGPGALAIAQKSLSTAADLRRCLIRGLDYGEAHPTLASSSYMRTLRADIIGALIDAVDAYDEDDLRVVTVINSQWRLSAARLTATHPSAIKRSFRTHLDRAGIISADGFLVAFLHGEFEPISETFQLHFHLLTTATKATALKQLIGRWGYVKTPSGASPFKLQKVKDREKQISYLFKSFWVSRAIVVVEGRKIRQRTGCRIKNPFHAEYLIWLHSAGLQDLMLLNKALHRGGKISILNS